MPAPDYDRINQQVFNVIVHHTDTPNEDTNYTDIVRSIYVYHTQVRGWSDIGYNYLIAPNGVIYKGRDPGPYDQDNVKGAHFCNSNSGTMGISMIGTFTDTVPTDSALNSLVDLITWKLGKENLDPLGTHWHTLNPELPTVAGHRDGCATQCPGDKLYALLDNLRNAVWMDFNQCGYKISPVEDPEISARPVLNVYGNTVHVRIESGQIRKISLFDLSGRQIPLNIVNYNPQEVQFNIPGSRKGMYLIKTETSKTFFVIKLVLE